MRITVHLDAFDKVDPSAYAVLWCDKEARRWSREGHFGIELPEWGRLEELASHTLVQDASGFRTFCVLEGLDMADRQGPYEGERGSVRWSDALERHVATGHWHVQCVDPETPYPEHSVFADLGPE